MERKNLKTQRSRGAGRADRDGAAYVLVILISLALVVVCLGIAGIGETIRQKIEMQNAADAAAYSAAIIQSDVFSACAQLNQAISFHYGALLSATADYITAKWLIGVREDAERTWLENMCPVCGVHWGRWEIRMPYRQWADRSPSDITPVDWFEFDARTPQIPELIECMFEAQSIIEENRQTIADLCRAARKLKENAPDMVRAEAHDVLRKNTDLPGLLSGCAVEPACFFACDMDPGDEGEKWFEPILLQGEDEDPAWKHIAGDFWNTRFLTPPDDDDRPVRWALGLKAGRSRKNPDFWLRTFGENFPGRYNSDDSYPQERPDEHWYLRAQITYDKAFFFIDPSGEHTHWWVPMPTVEVLAGNMWDDCFDLKKFFEGDNEFTWYRRPADFFRCGVITVGLIRRMGNPCAMFDDGTGSSMFRFFDPDFWLNGVSRCLTAAASARAGYSDGKQGEYNPTADANYDPARDEEDAWEKLGWTMLPQNGFTPDWDAVLLPLKRASSWRKPGAGNGRDGQWDDGADGGTGHDTLKRLFAGRWYATDSNVSLSESDLFPQYDGLAHIPGIAEDFPAPAGWDASDPARNLRPSSQGSALDLDDARGINRLLKH